MGYLQAIRELASHRADISGVLSADTLRYLRELIGRLSQAGADDDMEIAAEIGEVLDQVLPHDDHPVRQALDAETRRSATAVGDLAELAGQLLQEWDSAEPALAAAPSPSPAEVEFWTSRWLLGQAALTADELRSRGQDLADPDLIRLDRDDGGDQWPAFQFGSDGATLPLVRAVNRLLDAEEDPWGVADWWFGHNQWLDGVPARLIGRVPDDLVIAAARAVDPGV